MSELTFRANMIETTTETFSRLRRATRKSVLRQSTAAAGRVQTRAVKKAAPRRSGVFGLSLTSKVKQYPSGVVVAVIGQSRGGRFGERAAARLEKQRSRGRSRAAGLSGRGLAVPIHLVDQPVKSHSIVGRLKFGSSEHPVSKVEHPGHSGKQFLTKSARASNDDALEKFGEKFAERTEAAARQNNE